MKIRRRLFLQHLQHAVRTESGLQLGKGAGAGCGGLDKGLGLARQLACQQTRARGVDLLLEVLHHFVRLAHLGRDKQVDNDTARAQPLDFDVLDVNVGGGGDIREHALLEILVVADCREINIESQRQRHRIFPRGRRRSRLRRG